MENKLTIYNTLTRRKELFVPLHEKYEWGYIIPQMITGSLNLHPEEAIKIRKTEAKNEYRKFYERMINTGMV